MKPAPNQPMPRPRRQTLQGAAYRLHGHSGAQLLLLPRDGGHVVRKTSGSAAQNPRLMAQAERQRELFFSGIAVPRIVESGTDDAGHFYFEMEYISGQTAANMIASALALDLRPLEDALGRLFDFLRLTASGSVPAAAIIAKIEQVAACDSKVCQQFRSEIAGASARLLRLDWSGMPQSAGHGDLTLENILVSPRRGVVFIDCDVCFASSYWLDAGKLFQDVAGHWCLRALQGQSGPALVNAIQQMSAISEPLLQLIGRVDAALPERLPQIAALHLFRTLPYVRDVQVASFVLNRLTMLTAP